VNKGIAAGIIAAVVVIIVVSALSYSNNLAPNIGNQETITEEPVNTTGRHFTVELEESVGIAENP